ncbi:MAG: GAF domain-containing protein [Limisphaerales bacterium]
MEPHESAGPRATGECPNCHWRSELNRTALAVHSSLEPKDALHRLVAEAVRLVGATSGSLVLRNPNSSLLEIEAATGLPREATVFRLAIGKGVTGWVALHGTPARVGDVRRDARYIKLREEVRSELAVPVLLNGEVSGVLNVDSEQENAFTEADEVLLVELAEHAAVVIRNTWLFEQARRRTALATSLVSIARVINSATGLEELFKVVTREAVKVTGAKLSSVLMIGDTPDTLEVRASHGAGPDYLGRGSLRIEESLVGVVIRRRKPLQVEDVRSSRLYQSTEVARREGLVSLLSVPLIQGEEARGALNVYTGQLHTFSNEEIQTLGALAELCAMALERARWAERMSAAEEQLRQSDKLCALGLLAAEVAHEIRNPLTVMKMLFHSMDLRFPAGDPRSEDARLMGTKMDHLNRIVEQVLDFARHSEPRLEWVTVGGLLEDLRLLTRHKLRAQGVELAVEVEADSDRIRADSVQLEQAFLNVILNAAEAMPDGGKLAIVCAKSGEGCRISFTDTGPGLPDTMTASMAPGGFLFGTTKRRGTGLGLAIVNRVVETHRGRMELKSEAGRGTTVAIHLPRDPAS